MGNDRVNNGISGSINKTAIKNFAVYSRNKLIKDIKNKAAMIGVTESGIQEPLSSSTGNIQLFDIGTQEPYRIEGKVIEQRNALIQELKSREKASSYETAYETLIEEVAYTWFNRIIAIRFMEVNNYMPDRMRILSSGVEGINEPEFITHVFENSFGFSEEEKNRIIELKTDGSNLVMDELFQFLFIKQCNALNANLPELFEKTNDYTELLLTVSYNDVEGVIYNLVHNVPEEDFDVNSESGHGQIEIIGWLYQYYNTEPKALVDKAVKDKKKVDKFQLPAKTQLFTPDWIVKYMVENSLGRLWIEKLHANGDERSQEKIASQFGWQYYLPEAEQDEDVLIHLDKLCEERRTLSVEDITFLDPAMGSFHIGIYAFEVFMQLYESEGYTTREAAKLIIEKNLHGLEIDKRATQLSYFACMMQARKYNRKILDGSLHPHVYEIIECNDISLEHLDYMGNDVINEEIWKSQKEQIISIVDTFRDAKEYGSLTELNSEYNLEQLKKFVQSIRYDDQISLFNTLGLEETQKAILNLINVARLLSRKYDVVITNPPYMGSSAMNSKLVEFGKKYYPNSKSDLFAMFIEWGNKRVKNNGCNAMVTMQSWMFLSSYKDMRESLLEKYTISNLMHMENMVMGIAFGTAVTLFWNTVNDKYTGIYHYVQHKQIKNDRPVVFPDRDYRYSELNQDHFKKIPGAPIAYWMDQKQFSIFDNSKLINFGKACKGIDTGKNDRFLRLWHEVNIEKQYIPQNRKLVSEDFNKKWFPYNKGGEYRKWFGNNQYVINWENRGETLKKFKGSNLRNPNTYFKKGATWSTISSKNFSLRFFDYGFLFDNGGCCLFSEDNLEYLGALLNSEVGKFLLKISPTINFQPGEINKLPIIVSKEEEVKKIVQENIYIAEMDWNSFETSWEFKEHPLLSFKEGAISMADAYGVFSKSVETRFSKLKDNECKLNNIFIESYGLEEDLHPVTIDKDITITKLFDTENEIYDSVKGNRYILTKRDVIKSFISYAVGCIFGRYSLDRKGLQYAGNEWDDNNYVRFVPTKDNIILVSDEEHLGNNIVDRIIEFVNVTYGTNSLDENLQFIADSLGGTGTPKEIIRNYVLKDFYKDHTQLYQKRPIYWLYDSGKQNGFKALIYMHRYNEDTTGKVRVDYLHQVQKSYERMISNLQEDIANCKDAKESTQLQKRIEKLTKQLKECKEYDERLGHMAMERIPIDLDDGVKVNYQKIQTGSKGKFYQILAEI